MSTSTRTSSIDFRTQPQTLGKHIGPSFEEKLNHHELLIGTIEKIQEDGIFRERTMMSEDGIIYTYIKLIIEMIIC